MARAQPDLFGGTGWPEGFAYRDAVLSAAEEAGLVRHIETLPFAPFAFHGHLGKRRVVSFGWRYDHAGRALTRSTPIPDFLLPLRTAAAAAFAGIDAQALQQILVTEYAPGAGIGWHRDKPVFEDVVAISLLSPCRLRFRRARAKGWERAEAGIAPRSAYLLRGEARTQWHHAIPPMAALRYSITLRNFAARGALTPSRG